MYTFLLSECLSVSDRHRGFDMLQKLLRLQNCALGTGDQPEFATYLCAKFAHGPALIASCAGCATKVQMAFGTLDRVRKVFWPNGEDGVEVAIGHNVVPVVPES